MSATTSGQSVPVKETVTLPPAMAALQKWRNSDHEDRLTLTRDDVITLIEEEWSALLAALDEAEARANTHRSKPRCHSCRLARDSGRA